MPTGYTAAIKDGISFKEYALSCARAFGALVTMRDDPEDAPIPDEFRPGDYNLRRLNEAQERLTKLQSMTDEECDSEAEAELAKAKAHHEHAIKERNELKVKYLDMLAKVRAFQSPSEEHDGYKKFMEEQIVQSIDFDCGGTYHEDALDGLKKLPTKEWREREINKCLHDISYNSEEQKKENERAAGRSQWVQQLKKALESVK